MMKNPRYLFVYCLLFFFLQGQIALVINTDFKTKITTDDQLKQDAIADKKYYDALQPPSRDMYGGLPGGITKLGLHATGFFPVEKHHAKPVLVDPLGNLYFSIGVNGVGYIGDTYTNVKGRENIYEWLRGACSRDITGKDWGSVCSMLPTGPTKTFCLML
jgi:hypothetical protein